MRDPVKLPAYAPLAPPSGATLGWSLPLELLTPLYGGGARTRQVDRETPVRASSIRGQLRFWWRALFAGEYSGPSALYRRERELWGGIGDQHADVRRSRVALSIDVRRIAGIDDSSPGQREQYALWPAAVGGATAPRYRSGMPFDLQVRVEAGADVERDQREVRQAIRAWLLFGGVGGRTRRGCGAIGLATPEGRAEWLPEVLDAEVLATWLSPARAASQGFPSLKGAGFRVGASTSSATSAWHTALGWLREFRQGVGQQRDVSAFGAFARLRPSMGSGAAGRAGRSRWPEPDVIRHVYGPNYHDHQPQVPSTLRIWPRAQFGLPVQVRFQKNPRPGAPAYPNRTPPDVTIAWSPDGRSVSQRLASPLILRPVQLRNGNYAPMALWLTRTLPDRAVAGLLEKSNDRRQEPRLRRGSTGPINVPLPDELLFTPLSGKESVREAFLDWLQTTQRLSGGEL